MWLVGQATGGGTQAGDTLVWCQLTSRGEHGAWLMINTHAGCRPVTPGKAGPGLFLCRVPGRRPLGTAQSAAWCTRAQRAELPPPGLELRGGLGAAAWGHPGPALGVDRGASSQRSRHDRQLLSWARA